MEHFSQRAFTQAQNRCDSSSPGSLPSHAQTHNSCDAWLAVVHTGVCVCVCVRVFGGINLLPGRVAGVSESEVADPQLVHGAQGAQAAVDGVTPLHPDQTGCLVLAEGRPDVCER